MDNIEQFQTLTTTQMAEISGGVSITIMGVTFVGWKAAALISAGVTTLAGAAGLGLWNGYKDTKDQKN